MLLLFDVLLVQFSGNTVQVRRKGRTMTETGSGHGLRKGRWQVVGSRLKENLRGICAGDQSFRLSISQKIISSAI